MTHEEIMDCLEDTSIIESYYAVSTYVYPCLFTLSLEPNRTLHYRE